MVDTEVHRRFRLRHKSYPSASIGGINNPRVDYRSSKEDLFSNTPPIWMSNDDLKRRSIFLPNLSTVKDTVFKKGFGMSKEVTKKIAVDCLQRHIRRQSYKPFKFRWSRLVTKQSLTIKLQRVSGFHAIGMQM